MIYAAFSDSTKTTIIAVFSSPQDAIAWPQQDEIDASDSRYKAFYTAQPAFIQTGMLAATS
jgi:hypothetical protein